MIICTQSRLEALSLMALRLNPNYELEMAEWCIDAGICDDRSRTALEIAMWLQAYIGWGRRN